MSETDRWTTVRVTMAKDASEQTELESATELLEGLAALLAEREDVGGVELRDPTCITEGPEFVAVERPELLAYTTPDKRELVIAAVRGLAEQLRLPVELEVEDHAGDDWRDAWKRHYRPQRFTASGPGGEVALLIRPSWIEREPEDPPLELVLDPGRAFGTGLHESTRLCLQALVELAASGKEPPTRVLDLGCGSGILGLAAARLWPALLEPTDGRPALCLADHDPEAVETARENAAANAMTTAIQFSKAELHGPWAPPSLTDFCGPQGAGLVFANIRPVVLIPSAPAIIPCLAPGGTLVLSGILDEEGDAVRSAYAKLEILERPREADWCALILARRSEP